MYYVSVACSSLLARVPDMLKLESTSQWILEERAQDPRIGDSWKIGAGGSDIRLIDRLGSGYASSQSTAMCSMCPTRPQTARTAVSGEVSAQSAAGCVSCIRPQSAALRRTISVGDAGILGPRPEPPKTPRLNAAFAGPTSLTVSRPGSTTMSSVKGNSGQVTPCTGPQLQPSQEASPSRLRGSKPRLFDPYLEQQALYRLWAPQASSRLVKLQARPPQNREDLRTAQTPMPEGALGARPLPEASAIRKYYEDRMQELEDEQSALMTMKKAARAVLPGAKPHPKSHNLTSDERSKCALGKYHPAKTAGYDVLTKLAQKHPSKLLSAFRELDNEGIGVITYSELERILRAWNVTPNLIAPKSLMQMIDSMSPPTGISQGHSVSGLVDYHQLMHGLTAQPFHPAGSTKATGVKMSVYEHYIEPKSLKHTKTVVNRKWDEIFEHADGAPLDRNASVGGLPITHKIVDQIQSPKRAFLSSARHKMQV